MGISAVYQFKTLLLIKILFSIFTEKCRIWIGERRGGWNLQIWETAIKDETNEVFGAFSAVPVHRLPHSTRGRAQGEVTGQVKDSD